MHKILLPSHGHVGGLRLFHGALSLLQSPGSCSSSELCCCLSIYEQGLKKKKNQYLNFSCPTYQTGGQLGYKIACTRTGDLLCQSLSSDFYREIQNYLKVPQCIIAVSLVRVISGEFDLLLMNQALLICNNLAVLR